MALLSVGLIPALGLAQVSDFQLVADGTTGCHRIVSRTLACSTTLSRGRRSS
jgi:hypothetical protein